MKKYKAFIPIAIEIDEVRENPKKKLKEILSDLSKRTFSVSSGNYYCGKRKCRIKDISVKEIN